MAKKKTSEPSVFEQMKMGLEECLAHARGELTLVTIEVPAPPPAVTPQKIVALRKSLRMSQSVFAATLNVSARTIQSWEQGLREPSDASLRLLQIIKSEPSVLEKLFGGNPSSPKRTSRETAAQTKKSRITTMTM